MMMIEWSVFNISYTLNDLGDLLQSAGYVCQIHLQLKTSSHHLFLFNIFLLISSLCEFCVRVSFCPESIIFFDL